MITNRTNMLLSLITPGQLSLHYGRFIAVIRILSQSIICFVVKPKIHLKIMRYENNIKNIVPERAYWNNGF